MSERFVIQEIITQDWSGVFFRAIDLESGNPVGLHRFFPFGLSGVEAEGLAPEERDEYRSGVQDMTELMHPAFRRVISGGCDPVDGVPFVVTEWIEGESLSQLLNDGPLDPEVAFGLLNQALLVCEAISMKLGIDAFWLCMLPELIVRDCGKQERGFTFTLSPHRWLVDSRDRRSLRPLANLTDFVMGWTGQMVSEQMGGGLGGWVKWLRGPGQSASLAEARLMLDRFTGRAPESPPATPLTEVADLVAPTAPVTPAMPIAPATPTVPPRAPITAVANTPPPSPARPVPSSASATVQPSTGKGLWIAMALLVAAICGVLVWVAFKPDPGEGGGGNQTARPRSAAEVASARAAELARQAEKGEPDGATDVSETDMILGRKGMEITIVGDLQAIDESESGKTVFLQFRNSLARGRVEKSKADSDLTASKLQTYVGKRVRLTGKVTSPGGKPVISFTSLTAIEEAP